MERVTRNMSRASDVMNIYKRLRQLTETNGVDVLDLVSMNIEIAANNGMTAKHP